MSPQKYFFVDHTGYTFNNGSKVRSINKYERRAQLIRWNIICKCGKDFTATSESIEKKKIVACYICQNKTHASNHLEGFRFGILTVLIRSSEVRMNRGATIPLWECVCDCGKIKTFAEDNLIHTTKSCGCIRAKTSSERIKSRWDKIATTSQRKENLISRRNGKNIYYHKLIKYIYKRDNYKCRICYSKIKINAHHMDAWSTSKEKRFEETNLITLCKECHKKFHSKYGKGYTTIEQFSKYLLEYNLIIDKFLLEFDYYKSREGFNRDY